MAKRMMKNFELWKKRVEFSEENFIHSSRHHGWHRFVDYFNGIYRPHIGVDIPVTKINKVYSFVQTAKASLYFRDPKITVNAERPDAILAAILKEEIINYTWRKKKIKRQTKKCIGEAKTVGFSYMKVGFDADFSVNEIAGEVQETVTREDVWAIHIPYENILYDFASREPLHDSRWVIHWFLKPTNYLKERYNRDDIKATSFVNRHFHGKRRHQSFHSKLQATDSEMTKVYEIWDKDSRGRYLMCDGCEGWLEQPIIAKDKEFIGPLKMEGFPIVMLRYTDLIGDTFDNYPIGEVEAMEEQILEKIKIRSMMTNHIKRFSRQVVVQKGLFDEEAIDQYTKGQDGEVIEVNEPPADKIWSPSYPNLQTDIYAIENRNDVDMDEISGQPAFERGGQTQTKSRTLGELKQIGAGSQNRQNEQKDITEDFCEEIATKLLQIMKDKFDMKKTVRITGRQPQQIMEILKAKNLGKGGFITFSKEDIIGEEDVSVKMGSSIPLNTEGMLAALTEILRFGHAIGLAPGTVASAAVGSNILRMLGIEEVEQAYQKDVERLLAPKKPSPKEVADLNKSKAGTENTVVDTELKKNRIQKGQLDLVGKMVGNRQDLENLQNPKEPAKK